MTTSRRVFLSTAGLAAASVRRAETAPVQALPTVPLGQHRVSRLISGNNQLYGYAHFNWLLNRHMTEWATPERIYKVWLREEQQGINTTLIATSPGQSLLDIKRHWLEGGKMQALFLVRPQEAGQIPELGALKPVGIAHHGTYTDKAFREGTMDQVREFLKKIRDTGAPVGISTHNPRVIEYVEERGWDVDYYQGCLYVQTRTSEEVRKMAGGELPLGEVYFESDPERMCKVVRQTRKFCIVFKLLAAGRLIDTPALVRERFRFALTNIKPGDCIMVGMYPRYKDEVRENADLVRKILAKA